MMQIDHSAATDYIFALAASPTFSRDGLVFAARQCGLFRSADHGQTWNDAYAALQLETPLATTCALICQAGSRRVVFAGVEGHLLRSEDDGATWAKAALGSPAPVISALAASPDFEQDGIVLAATAQDGVFCSTDHGQTLTGWNFGLYDPNIYALAYISEFAGAQAVLAGTQCGLFISRTAGRAWKALNFPIEAAPVLCVASSRGTIYAGTETEGLWAGRAYGTAWQQLLPGSVDQIFAGEGEQLLVLVDGQIRYSPDGGARWLARGSAPVEVTCFAAPQGLGPQAPLLAGLASGEVVRL